MEEKKSFKTRLEELSYKAKWKAYDFTDWCKNHKEVIIVFGPIIVGCGMEIIKTATKAYSVHEDKNLKERYIYDHRLGHYYELKRQPKNSEWLMIEQRKNNGESLGMILNDMNLLK